jgi:hypothetical protein
MERVMEKAKLNPRIETMEKEKAKTKGKERAKENLFLSSLRKGKEKAKASPKIQRANQNLQKGNHSQEEL